MTRPDDSHPNTRALIAAGFRWELIGKSTWVLVRPISRDILATLRRIGRAERARRAAKRPPTEDRDGS